jgi:type IV pilus assembly protein PilQ
LDRSRIGRITVVALATLAAACGGETRARPAARAPAPDGAHPAETAPSRARAAAPLPLPDTAFQPDAPPEAHAHARSDANGRTRELPRTSAPDRFQTRRIGAPSDGAAARRFTGARVDLDLKSADLKDVFRLLADVGKVNIVVAEGVSGAITLRLRRVPWDQALDVIARAKGLGVERDGNVLLVSAAGARSGTGAPGR